MKIVKVKAGSLKVIGKGLPFAVPNGPATIDVVLSIDGGTNTYCMTFTGTGDGSKFLVKDAPDAACPPPAPTATPTSTSTSTPTVTPTITATPTAPPTCGNNMQEGTEVCDGTDDTACPFDCLPDCTCAPVCPATGGDATVCFSYLGGVPCTACCGVDASCNFYCYNAATLNACASSTLNDLCAAAANNAGCAAECCP